MNTAARINAKNGSIARRPRWCEQRFVEAEKIQKRFRKPIEEELGNKLPNQLHSMRALQYFELLLDLGKFDEAEQRARQTLGFAVQQPRTKQRCQDDFSRKSS